MIRKRPTRSSPPDDATSLAGWLYTDLLLGLAVVFLGGAAFLLLAPPSAEVEGGDSIATTVDTSVVTTTTIPESTTTTTTTIPPVLCTSLGSEAQIFRIQLNGNVPDEQLAFDAENQIALHLANLGLPPDTAIGFSLAFGGPDLQAGPRNAENVAARLKALLPARMGAMPFRSYGNTALSSSQVEMDMFPLVTTACP